MNDAQLTREALPIIEQAIIDKTLENETRAETKAKIDRFFSNLATIGQDYNNAIGV
jgi:hypothetical protein